MADSTSRMDALAEELEAIDGRDCGLWALIGDPSDPPSQDLLGAMRAVVAEHRDVLRMLSALRAVIGLCDEDESLNDRGCRGEDDDKECTHLTCWVRKTMADALVGTTGGAVDGR